MMRVETELGQVFCELVLRAPDTSWTRNGCWNCNPSANGWRSSLYKQRASTRIARIDPDSTTLAGRDSLPRLNPGRSKHAPCDQSVDCHDIPCQKVLRKVLYSARWTIIIRSS